MNYRGKPCDVERDFIDGTGAGREGLVGGKVVCRKYATRIRTPEEIARDEANADQMAQELGKRERLGVLAEKAGNGTATAAERDEAVALLAGFVVGKVKKP